MFISPYILGLVPLALLPVVIHLIHRQKYPRFLYSSLLFFDRITRQNVFRWKFRHVLLMLLRVLLVLLMVFAFARFGCQHVGFGDRSVAVMVVLDTSPSMTRSFGEGTMLDFAKGQAESTVSDLGEGALAGLVVNTRPAEVACAPAGEREDLIEAIESVEPTY